MMTNKCYGNNNMVTIAVQRYEIFAKLPKNIKKSSKIIGRYFLMVNVLIKTSARPSQVGHLPKDEDFANKYSDGMIIK